MRLKSNFLLVFAFFFVFEAKAKIDLVKMEAKQDLSNICFIGRRGVYTYYQSKQGHLSISYNYQSKVLIKGDANSFYQVSSSPARKKVTILKDEFFNTFYGVKRPKKIYLADFNGSNLTYIHSGTTPKLHLNDEWLSLYQPTLNKLLLVNTQNPVIKFSILIRNSIAPYFTPQVVFIDGKTIIYTQFNKQGRQEVVSYNRLDKKTKSIHTSEYRESKIELCQNQGQLYLSTFALDPLIKSSNISQVEFKKKNIVLKSLYQSSKQDIGQVYCNEANKGLLYFIKDVAKGPNQHKYEVVEWNIKKKSFHPLTNLYTINQLIPMDGNLLIPHNGAFYFVKQILDFKSDKLDDKK